MQKVYCITVKPEVYTVERFREEANFMGLDFEILNIKNLYYEILDSSINIYYNDKLIDFDQSGVILRNVQRDNWNNLIFVLKVLKHSNVPVLNSECILGSPNLEDKLIQSTEFRFRGIPGIFPLANNILNSVWMQNPVVVKPRIGSGGEGISLVQDISNLSLDNPNLIQRYIKSDFDVRIITTKNSILGGMSRSVNNSIVNNYSAGGSVKEYPVNDNELVSLSKKICGDFNSDYLGIDFIFENDKPYVLEINRFCQFKGFEESTDVNVARSFLKLLRDKYESNISTR